jgi:electron transfer flavoprotein alpha subunit
MTGQNGEKIVSLVNGVGQTGFLLKSGLYFTVGIIIKSN